MINNGWLDLSPPDSVVVCASPNFNDRPVQCAIDLIVVHNISLPPNEFGGGFIEQFFLNVLNCAQHPYFQTIEGLEVSAHCLIARDGTITQFVSFLDRAWHAGLSEYQGRVNCNDFSIGIELEGTDECLYTDEQYERLGSLIKALLSEYPAITKNRIVGHSDIAPGRKTDPGPAFDWMRLRTKLDAE